MVLEMVLESVFAIADIFFVSKLGADAVSAVGITESLLSIVYALSIGLSIGTAALISRRTGEKRPEDAAKIAGNSIILALFISIFISVLGFGFAEKLLILMGADKNIIATGIGYTRIMFASNVVIMLLFVINAIFRNTGDAAISMHILWVANGNNLILDPILIFGLWFIPALGVKGAAIATTIGRGSAVIFQLYVLFKGTKRMKLVFEHFKIDIKIIYKIVQLSLGGIFQNIIATSSWIFLVRIISSFGSVVVAGYTIAIRILMFTILPSWGIGNAAATLTGQNLGAKQPKRAEKSVLIAALINMVFLSLVAIILISFSQSFISFFINDEEVIANGTNGMKIKYGTKAVEITEIGIKWMVAISALFQHLKWAMFMQF